MSLPLTPFERWQEGTTQPRLPVNDNSLRVEIAMTNGIANDVTAQPGSPDDGDWYIIPSGATGTQWATFAEDSIAIFYSGTWYEFVPMQGNRVMVAGVFYIFDESDGWEAVTIPATSAADDVSYDNTTSGLSATDVQAAIDEIAAAAPGSGDVVGPGSAVDSRIAVFDGTSGKLIKDGGKTVAGLRAPAIQSVTSSGTVTPTFADDMVVITAQAAALTLANPTGTAIPGLGMVIRIKDNGTARAISYGTQYRAIGITLPTTTVIGKTTYIAAIYNVDDTTWDCIATGTQA